MHMHQPRERYDMDHVLRKHKIIINMYVLHSKNRLYIAKVGNFHQGLSLLCFYRLFNSLVL